MRRDNIRTDHGRTLAGFAWAATLAVVAIGPTGRAAGPGDDPKPTPTAPCCADCEVCKAAPDGQPAAARYARMAASYKIPDVKLLGADGRETSLPAALDHDGPVLLQFIFTTCPTICPAMTGTFSSFQEKLGDEVKQVRMISISIDPEHDRPERLRAFARRFDAGPRWAFYTGRAEDIAAVRKAFDADSANKMWHRPLTFLRPRPGASWTRYDGLMGVAELIAEYRRMVQK
jgi:protein SCO1/2